MYSKIIVGDDGSDQARDALALGKLLAAETAAAIETVKVETRAPGSAPAARGLNALADSEQADLIVLGSTHRRGRALTGTVAEHLFHDAPCAVAIAPAGFAEQADPGLRVIGVAFDGSPESRAALTVAAELGEAAGAALRIFGVAESDIFLGYAAAPTGRDPGELIRSQKAYLEDEIATAIEGLSHKLRPLSQVLSGNAAELLAAKADEGVDLLLMGSRGRGPARRVMLGSVSSKLARSAPCPLLVVPRAAGRGKHSGDQVNGARAAPPGSA